MHGNLVMDKKTFHAVEQNNCTRYKVGNMKSSAKKLGHSSNNTQDIQLNIPSIGVGTLRTSATWIAVMLMAEDNPAQILAGIMKELSITPEQVSDEYHDKMCSKCGMSLLLHRDNNGECF